MGLSKEIVLDKSHLYNANWDEVFKQFRNSTVKIRRFLVYMSKYHDIPKVDCDSHLVEMSSLCKEYIKVNFDGNKIDVMLK